MFESEVSGWILLLTVRPSHNILQKSILRGHKSSAAPRHPSSGLSGQVDLCCCRSASWRLAGCVGQRRLVAPRSSSDGASCSASSSASSASSARRGAVGASLRTSSSRRGKRRRGAAAQEGAGSGAPPAAAPGAAAPPAGPNNLYTHD